MDLVSIIKLQSLPLTHGGVNYIPQRLHMAQGRSTLHAGAIGIYIEYICSQTIYIYIPKPMPLESPKGQDPNHN